MPYTVDFDPPARPLGKTDVVFKVVSGGNKIGELRVSKGSLVWFPRDAQIGYKVNWEKFGTLMESGTKAEKRRYQLK